MDCVDNTVEFISHNICVQLKYTLGQVTRPNVGRIYVFEDYYKAHDASQRLFATNIFRCECSDFVYVPAIMAPFTLANTIELFTRDWTYVTGCTVCLIGKHIVHISKKFATVSWIKPIEEV